MNANAPCPYAIEVENLTKRFRVRHMETLKSTLLGLRGRREHVEPFTALDNVSFTIPHGQTVAVIGRNGSGKSTLLGILARIYVPTSGIVHLWNTRCQRARLATLLELGAGFHHELTGLENIQFFAAMLGMSEKEIDARTPQIVAFSELGDKIDTQLRTWNDGAKLRLGFSIAVHTDPDILLIDEVLAVGDEAFQQKCYRLIASLQAQGKTILFVSHDLLAVERVAERVLWMHRGVIRMDGDPRTVLDAYRAFSAEQGG
ncbi:MAG: ABC transporter ATP-binding protein [Chloroherpetonaceae bacterium]|nr:ABC transporter ATP-binding protein [Chthonomonadaceae bacterium]MDW8207662.1 ABC transporter ATP-binding protein [Chloroherpetonaceae bacterium]